MDPEIWVSLVAVFISGGAIGSTGILLAQWIVKKVDSEPSPRRSLEVAEFDVLRGEVAEMGKRLRNLDARLDFTEQLIGGALPLAPPPARLPDATDEDANGDESVQG